jgi:hypothetical protein
MSSKAPSRQPLRRIGWSAALVAAGLSLALAQPAQSPQPRELIYGSELMTDAELDKYRADLGRAGSDAERARYRERHRVQLRERARVRGIELEEPAGVVRRKDTK